LVAAVLTAAALVAALLPTAAPVAVATPTSSVRSTEAEIARAKAAEAEVVLERLATELEMRSERYFAAKEQLDNTCEQLAIAQEELDLAEADVREAQDRLNERTVSIYRDNSRSLIAVILGATDFSGAIARLEWYRRLTESDAALISSLAHARDQAERSRTALEARKCEQVALADAAYDERVSVESALDKQKAYLATLDARVKALIEEDRARREAEAVERATARKRWEDITGGARASISDSSTAGIVVQTARSFVGKTPYLWGGTTPAGFDCSGLTQYCYREAGIAISRTSRTQFNDGQRIPPDRVQDLQPGDLVFFARGSDPGTIHHVGIYSGNGNYIHAPMAGWMVSEQSLIGRIETKHDYVGAVRP